VLVAVEIAFANQVSDAVEGRVVEQQAAEDRLLGFQRMGRHTQLGQHGVGLRAAPPPRVAPGGRRCPSSGLIESDELAIGNPQRKEGAGSRV
jgi:hypothetical protein